MNKEKEILKYSNPKIVYKNALKYLGPNVIIKLSDNPKKKYMVFDFKNNKWVHFGQMKYEDFTKHKNLIRRHNYLQRTLFMKGNWKNNRYSANNLARHLLWNA
jgi:hypothetical protein